MPAYFDTGFSVRQPMWHGEGLVLDEYPTDWEDARVKAGLTWEPELRPLYHKIGDDFVALTDHQVVVRDDTQAPLGPVSDTFGLVPNRVMGEIIELILGQGAKFETAGGCKGGAQVWALAYLDEPEEIAGDDSPTYPYIVFLNSHNGEGACKVLPTSVRVVCWNTYQAASMEGDRTGRQFVFRHTGDVLGRIEEAKAAMAGVRDEFKAWNVLANELVGMPIDDAKFNHFVSDFIPNPPEGTYSDRVRSNIDEARSIFKHIYLDSLTTDSHRGTGLGLVDAAVEYLDHARGYRNSDTYMGRTLLRPEPLKARAVALVRSL